MKPLAIDLYAGLGGWTDGLLAEGYRVVGFDNERHRYPAREIAGSVIKAPNIDFRKHDSFNGTTEKRLRACPLTGGWHEYPAQLVLQDVLTLHGSQFRNAALIVASPPCQAYSYMAMPWKRGKAMAAAIREDQTGRKLDALNALFNACFRIQREACEAAGHHIPMVVENVKGAQPWVGGAAWHYGSFYLWGDVPALMPNGPGPEWFDKALDERRKAAGVKGTQQGGGTVYRPDQPAAYWSGSSARKAASAQIAKIPFALSSWIAHVYRGIAVE